MTDELNAKQEAPTDPPSRVTALVSGIEDIIADMREQIDYARKHGDNWEADFLEGYSDPLNDLIEKYR